MKKILLFFSILLGAGTMLMAQSGFVSLGGNLGNSQGSVSFTFGQVFYEYVENTDANMTEGVQQPYLVRDTIYDEICQDTVAGSVYTNGNIELPITEAGEQVGEDYIPYGSYYHYDSATYIVLTIHPVYYHQDTILLHDVDLPYQIVSHDDTVNIEHSGETVLNLHSEFGCDSTVTVMAYVITCPQDTTFVAPYNVCSFAIPDSNLPQPTVEPENALLVLTNDAPAEFQVDDTTLVTWTYSLGSLSLDCQNEVIVAFPPCGTPNDTVVDYDGNVYNTVRVACHCWTKENLRPVHYSDGDDIPYAVIYNAPGYSDTVANLDNYGRLYDWYSALNLPEGYTGVIADSIQGICPEGWHIPTSEEWADLSAYSASSLKTENLWIVPGTNETQFSAVPGGYSWGETYFYNMTGNAYYWAAREYNSGNGEAYQFTYSCDYGNGIDSPKNYGYSVRCIKN